MQTIIYVYELWKITGGVIDKSMVKDDDEDDISDEEVQARLQALMDENNAEKASMEQVKSGICTIITEELLNFQFPGSSLVNLLRASR